MMKGTEHCVPKYYDIGQQKFTDSFFSTTKLLLWSAWHLSRQVFDHLFGLEMPAFVNLPTETATFFGKNLAMSENIFRKKELSGQKVKIMEQLLLEQLQECK